MRCLIRASECHTINLPHITGIAAKEVIARIMELGRLTNGKDIEARLFTFSSRLDPPQDSLVLVGEFGFECHPAPVSPDNTVFQTKTQLPEEVKRQMV